MKKTIVICFIAIVTACVAAFFLSESSKKTSDPKYVVVVAKFSDVFKYVVIRRHIDDHTIIKVDDKTFGHTHVGDSILHTGN